MALADLIALKESYGIEDFGKISSIALIVEIIEVLTIQDTEIAKIDALDSKIDALEARVEALED